MPEHKTFQIAIELGHSEAWDNDWEKAASYYQQALETNPDHPKTNSFLGLAFFELKQLNKSLFYYEKAARSAPDDPVPVQKIGQILEQLGKAHESIPSYQTAAGLFLQSRNTGAAIECLSRIVELSPDHIDAHIQLAFIHERRGKKQEAVNEYLAAAAIAQHSQQTDATQNAVGWVETCLQLVPNHPGAVEALSQLRSGQPLRRPPLPTPVTVKPETLQADMRADMRASLRASLPSLSPLEEADRVALEGLARFFFQVVNRQGDLVQNDDPDGAAALSSDSYKALRGISQALEFQTQGRPDLALAGLNKALQIGMEHACMHYMAGSILASLEPISSLTHLKQAYTDPDFSLAAVLLMGRILTGQGKNAEAAAAYLQALAIADSTAAAAGNSDALRQQYEPIIKAYSHLDDTILLEKVCRIIEAELNRPNWLNHLSTLRESCLDPEYGCNPIAEILIAGGSPMAERIVQVKKLMEMKSHYPAMDEAFSLLELEPTLLPVHLLIAEQLAQQNALEEAARKFKLAANLYMLRQQPIQGLHVLARAVQVAPMDVSIRSQLIQLLIQQDQPGAAAEQMLQLADIQYQLAELDNARQTLSEAVRLIDNKPVYQPLMPGLLSRKADLDLQYLDFRAAAGALEQIRSIEPENIQNRVRLVGLHYRMGQGNAAQKEMDGFIRLAENTHRHSLVIQFLDQLVAELPDELDIRKRLADHYFKQGDKPNTIEQLEAIASILLKKGSRDGASIVLKTIVALNPPNVSEYQQALAQLQRSDEDTKAEKGVL